MSDQGFGKLSSPVGANCCSCQPTLPTFRRSKRLNPALKTFLRRVGARTHEDLWQALADALETITPHDALGWFTHCGYFPAHQEVS